MLDWTKSRESRPSAATNVPGRGVRPAGGPNHHPIPAPADRHVRVGQHRLAEGAREGQPRAGTVVGEHEGGQIGLPFGQGERPGQHCTPARRPVAAQGEPIAEQRFEAEHVLAFDLGTAPGRIEGSVEIAGVEGEVERVHPQRPAMDDMAPSREQEVLRGGGVLRVELVHVEPHPIAVAGGGPGRTGGRRPIR